MKYRPVTEEMQPRFVGLQTFMQMPHNRQTDGVDVAIVGLPFDTGGTYRVGARFGPAAIRAASQMLHPYNPATGVDLTERLSAVDYGDLRVVPGAVERSHALLADGLEPLHRNGLRVIGLGGDHSVSLPHLQAAASVHGPLALIQFDSHSDLWDEFWGERRNHGTVIRRALEEGFIDPSASIQVGLRGSLSNRAESAFSREFGFAVLSTADLRHRPGALREAPRKIRERVGERRSFVTFDVDFVDPAFAPGTGTPEVGGFSSWETLELLRGLSGIEFVGFDVVEVIPAYDHASITALLAATVVHEMLGLVACSETR
ncbi:agmatinase [Limnochorda pilosa]|uniref:Guanidinobutyrase n=1 Tax=Limnochorda pilosa TaxID=1555112 RepID=A0A0K2SLE4_LIMPI|nr:agmatinase [Limnochorda pilosa]BAS27925.1 guanidinobutyrase [Limnochorda pilosa]